MYPVTERTTPHRYPDRVGYDRSAAHAILDEALVCHLGLVVDGTARVLPTLFARVGDTLYLHGSTGSGPMLAARDPAGLPVTVTVTLVDGLVLARSQFHHSVNYRCVVAYGTARLVDAEAERRAALNALVDKVVPGRSAGTRPPTARELAQTAVLALPLAEVSVKCRDGGVNEDAADQGLPYWAGVVPVRTVPGEPVPAPGVTVPAPQRLGRYAVDRPASVASDLHGG